MFREAHRHAKQMGKMGSGEHGGFGAVGHNAPFAQEDHAIDFRDDFGDVMGNQQNGYPGLRQLPQCVAQLELRGDVQRVAGLVKEQRSRLVDEGPRDERALGFAGRHLGHRAVGQMSDAQAAERVRSARQMLRIRMVVWKDARAAEKAGKDHVAPCGVRGARSQQIGRDDAQE